MTQLPAAVLWDFDGTLVDTEHFWVGVERGIFEDRGVPWIVDRQDELIGASIHYTADIMMPALGDPTLDKPAFISLVVNGVADMIRDNEVPYRPGARELLVACHEAGIPCAVVTASPRVVLDAALDRIGHEYFQVIVSGDDVRRGKPYPDAYALAAILLGVAARDCLAIEDSVNGCASARGAGAAVLAVPNMTPLPGAANQTRRDTLAGLTLADLGTIREEALATPEPGSLQTLAGIRTGVLRAGERVGLTDSKGRRHTIELVPGKRFHTTKGGLAHDEIIGQTEGIVVSTVGGLQFLVMRNLMHQYMVAMPREAAVIYPKDAGQIIMWTDIFPGARVLEAGVGSGALSIALLRAIGPAGTLVSHERRPEFARRAQDNVVEFYGSHPDNWRVVDGDLVETIADDPVDRVILDMLAPWECIDVVAERLVPGGMLCCYVATTTQMGRVMDTLRLHGGFTEPTATETTVRDWHAEGLSIRPVHSSTGHTGFLVLTRRLAPGHAAPRKHRRPSPGAYGPDYHGPRPFELPERPQDESA